MNSGDQQKNSISRLLIVIVLLILTLPLVYMFVARVLLPLAWDEPQFNETAVQPASE